MKENSRNLLQCCGLKLFCLKVTGNELFMTTHPNFQNLEKLLRQCQSFEAL